MNLQVDFPSPIVNRNSLVPNAPDEGRLFLCSSRAPGVLPIHLDVHEEGTSPFHPAKVDRFLIVANPIPGGLRKVLKQGNSAQPFIPVRIKFKL